jgi:hypothetical protein
MIPRRFSVGASTHSALGEKRVFFRKKEMRDMKKFLTLGFAAASVLAIAAGCQKKEAAAPESAPAAQAPAVVEETSTAATSTATTSTGTTGTDTTGTATTSTTTTSTETAPATTTPAAK